MVVRFFCAARPLRQSTADKEHSHEPEHESECERDGPEIQWQRPVGRQTQGIAFLVRRDMLHETMADFAKHCTLSPNQKVITYRRQDMR